MPREWMDVSDLSFNTLLLLEQVQLSWLPGWLPERDLQIALKANPIVEWYMRHKCPQLNEWLDRLMSLNSNSRHYSFSEIRQAEVEILSSMTDLMVYAVDPSVYDAQPFLGWDSTELLAMADFTGKTVIDVGAGTGRLTLVVAEIAKSVFAIEPVTNLRTYLKQKTCAQNLDNVFSMDGLITDIPFPCQFADITMAGHVFGEYLDSEYNEMTRVTKSGGTIILCPGNNDKDNEVHRFLISHGFEWSRFIEPRDGVKRKYWKTVQ
jgi:SAM-dependent methyltransferase